MYHRDFAEYAGSYYRNFGQAEGQIRFIATGKLLNLGTWFGPNIPALRGLDHSDEILLVLSEETANDLINIPKAGLLIVTDDAQKLARRYTLLSRDPSLTNFGGRVDEDRDFPQMWISAEMANRLLEGSGYRMAQLRHLAEDLKQDEIFDFTISKNLRMEVDGDIQEKVEVRHVIGYLPGSAAVPGEGQLDNHMVVLLAQYDLPPLLPDRQIPAGANDNAAGVAVMLEIIRAIQESGYQPYKTFLFVAYSAEGLEGGETVTPDVEKFLRAKLGFASAYEVDAVVHLRGLGAKDGNQLLLSASGSLRLANLFESAAKQMGVPTQRTGERVDISIVFADGMSIGGGDEAPHIGLFWEGWEITSRTLSDNLGYINRDHLEQAGEAISLALMILGRETQ